VGISTSVAYRSTSVRKQEAWKRLQ